MWICANDGFISIVASDRDPSVLNVRARRRRDLIRIFGADVKITTGVGTDYKYRTFLPRKKVADVIANRIEFTKYTNFKNSVVDHDLHDLYDTFWGEHRRYQIDEGKH